MKPKSIKKEKRGKLLSAVMVMLKKELETKSLQQIADHVGVPYFWLGKLLKGGIGSPSVDRIEQVYTKLSGKNLPI